MHKNKKAQPAILSTPLALDEPVKLPLRDGIPVSIHSLENSNPCVHELEIRLAVLEERCSHQLKITQDIINSFKEDISALKEEVKTQAGLFKIMDEFNVELQSGIHNAEQKASAVIEDLKLHAKKIEFSDAIHIETEGRIIELKHELNIVKDHEVVHLKDTVAAIQTTCTRLETAIERNTKHRISLKEIPQMMHPSKFLTYRGKLRHLRIN